MPEPGKRPAGLTPSRLDGLAVRFAFVIVAVLIGASVATLAGMPPRVKAWPDRCEIYGDFSSGRQVLVCPLDGERAP